MIPIQTSIATGLTNTFGVGFPYLDRSHVLVTLDGVLQVLGINYSFVTPSTIQFVDTPAEGVEVIRKRETPSAPMTVFQPGELDTADLNVASLQPLYLAEEARVATSSLIGDATAAADRAEAAAEDLEEAAADAQEAKDLVEGWAGDIVSQGNVPIYGTKAGLSSLTIPAGIGALRLNGTASMGDLGSADGVWVAVGTSDPGSVPKAQSQDGRWWRKYSNSYNVKDFGAVGDGSTDDTAAINLALAFIAGQRTSPYGKSNYGQNVLYFPKGRYKVTTGLTTGGAWLGLELRGAGVFASSIEFHNDSAALIAQNTFISVHFRDLYISHVAQDPDRTTWTNALFRGTGAGGGRMLGFFDCEVGGFDRVIDGTGTVNFDTISAAFSTFRNFNTFYRSRNTQAMCNTLLHCTFTGTGDLFDVAGGWWNIYNCNIVLDGAWCNLWGEASLWGLSAAYKFVGCKGEPFNQSAYPDGSRSALTRISNSAQFLTCQIMFDQCVLTSAVTYDPDPIYPQLEVGPNMSVIFTGGGFGGKITLRGEQAVADNFYKKGILFKDMISVPSPRAITRVRGGGVPSWPPVTYEGCNGVPNLTVGSEPRFTLGYDAESANFTVGSLLTGPSGTAIIAALTDGGTTGTLTLVNITGTFVDNEAITDADGGSALVNGSLTAVTTSNQAPLRINRAEQMNSIGGGTAVYAVLTFGAAATHELDFLGTVQDILDIAVSPANKASGNLFIETSLDNFTTVLDTFYIPSGTNILPAPASARDLAVGSKTQNWASLTDGSQQSTTVTVLGARVGDEVVGLGLSVALSGTRMWGEVTAYDTVTVYHRNDTGGTVDVASGTLTASVKRAKTVIGKTTTGKVYVRVTGGGPAYGHIHVKHRAR